MKMVNRFHKQILFRFSWILSGSEQFFDARITRMVKRKTLSALRPLPVETPLNSS